jgi:dihydrofolate synthase/folylpolyglutamate synthase
MMTYEEALAWWFAHANYEQRSPAPGDLKLERMRTLLGRLGDPHRRLRILHVAGSKGKGSTSAMLATILRRAGYRTGLFTSPHLCQLEERFQVDGKSITKAELAQLLTEIRNIVGQPRPLSIPPTFFEIATALGFLHFVRRHVDAALVEVGLGGRLDSTNVCRPVLSIITSISFDHTRILGNRLGQIAAEKAGIIKPGRPVVSGAIAPEARAVIEQVARQQHAPLVELARHVRYEYQAGRVTTSGPDLRPRVTVTTTRRWPTFEVNLLGEHQVANAAVVIASVEQLVQLGWHISDEAVRRGLAEVDWPARLEVVGRQPLIVLDCAHNVASAEALIETLHASFPQGRRILIFAGSGDKDVAGMFRVLSPHFSLAFMTRYTNNPRSIAAEQLASLWQGMRTVPVEVCATPSEALAQARRSAQPDDLICITGSVFLAGELRPLLVHAGQS